MVIKRLDLTSLGGAYKPKKSFQKNFREHICLACIKDENFRVLLPNFL